MAAVQQEGLKTSFPFQEPQPWKLQAACRGLNIAADQKFFPERGQSTREAKLICRKCPVQVECLEYAMANGERYGVWGGTNERDRKKIKRSRRIANGSK